MAVDLARLLLGDLMSLAILAVVVLIAALVLSRYLPGKYVWTGAGALMGLALLGFALSAGRTATVNELPRGEIKRDFIEEKQKQYEQRVK